MINLKHVEVFHAIMRTGSVTAAARLLHVTQPAVSAMLKHFENRLQMKLFERAGGRLVPTPEAQALLPDVAGIYNPLQGHQPPGQGLGRGPPGRLSDRPPPPVPQWF